MAWWHILIPLFYDYFLWLWGLTALSQAVLSGSHAVVLRQGLALGHLRAHHSSVEYRRWGLKQLGAPQHFSVSTWSPASAYFSLSSYSFFFFNAFCHIKVNTLFSLLLYKSQ